MRRAVSVIAGILICGATLGGLIAAWGSGASRPTLATTGPVTKASVEAYAEAVNLRPADLPGFASVSIEGPVKPTHSDLAYERCRTRGRKPSRSIATIDSSRFLSRSGVRLWQIESSVKVMHTARLASEATSGSQSPPVRACQAPILRMESLNGFGRSQSGRYPFRFGQFSASTLPSPLPGVGAHQTRWTIPLRYTSGGQEVHTRAYVDLIWIVIGRADIELRADGFTQPVSARIERRLIEALYRRARP